MAVPVDDVDGQASPAIEHGIEQRALQRAYAASELLARVGKELATSLDLEEVLERLVRAVVPHFADWCVVDAVEEGYQQRVAVAHVDLLKEELAREVQRRFEPISSEGSLMRQVLDSGQPHYVADLTIQPPSVDGLEPGDVDLLRQLAPTSMINVALSGRRGSIGVMSFLHSDSGRRFAPEDVPLAQEVANRAALAIENAQLFRDSERAAAERRQAEERQRFLADASKLLDSALDYEITLNSLAHLAVPRLADWCIVDVLQRGVLGDSLAIAAADPAKEALAREYQRRWPPQMDEPTGVAKVIRTGEPELASVITEEMIAAGAKDPEHLSIMRALGPWSSGMSVPLTARGTTLGALTLIAAESGRKYGPDDLDLAMEVASRAALAVDNARLYAAEQRARAEAERLQQLTQKLGQSLAAEEVLDRIAATAAELLRAPVAGVFLLDSGGEFFELVAGVGLSLEAKLRLPRGQSLAGQVIATEASVSLSDARSAPVAALPRLVSGESVGSLVVSPIIGSSGPLGVVEVYSTTIGIFDQHHAELLSSLAGAAAAVLENARLYRQREVDLARLHTIVDQLPVGIVVVEAPSGEVSLKNAQAEQLYGSALDALRAGVEDKRSGFHPDGRAYERDEWPLARALMAGEVVSNERIEIARPDGGKSHVSINAAPIRNAAGNILAAVAIFDDVSGEEELRRQKEQFLAAAAHDLKTPLTSIRGLTQLLQKQLGRLTLPQPERVGRTLEGIAGSTRKMTALIEELLDISRLETIDELSLTRSHLDLIPLAREVLDTHRANAPHHELELETTLERLVGCWDGARLERALSNLVGNAIKYSPEGGAVRVGISAEDSGANQFAVITVSDSGIGIPEHEINRIFERYLRGSNVPNGLSGSGVGLSYVKQIIVQHGGSIEVESQPGVSATFTVRLPLRED